MDGHFVPNITIGPEVISKLRKYSSLPFDVHLMISPVHNFIKNFAEAGADIVGVSASLEKDSDVGKDIVKRGKSFVGYACDFSNREGLHDFIDQVNQDVGQIDILVNIAGTIMRARAEVHSDEYWDKVLEVYLSAQFVLGRSFGSKMLERETGKIILI